MHILPAVDIKEYITPTQFVSMASTVLHISTKADALRLLRTGGKQFSTVKFIGEESAALTKVYSTILYRIKTNFKFSAEISVLSILRKVSFICY